MDEKDSILESVKKMLGIHEEYTHFDSDLIMHINSVFMILTQLGVGPKEGFAISDSVDTWNEFIPEDQNIQAVKTYMHHKVKLLFDPPLSATVMECMNRVVSELEWRLNIEVETPKPVEEEVY